MNRGAIDFNFSEAKILVDEQGKPVEIVKRPRTIAEQLIEEFMLAANETVAEHFFRLEIPFLYRIHENPDTEKLQSFFEFITRFGYSVGGRRIRFSPRALQQLLEEIQGKPEETRDQHGDVPLDEAGPDMRRSAWATSVWRPSFYTHFTSPIRRYPDLMIHRIIREVLDKGNLSAAADRSSERPLPDDRRPHLRRERIAIEAERETDDLKKAEFMMDKIGEEFEGMISSVTSFGIFVELENTVEGLVHVSYMNDDYYHYDEDTYCLYRRTDRKRVPYRGPGEGAG